MLVTLWILVTALLWGGLWGYATLLIALIWMREQDSEYAYPMRIALDRLVESVGCNWLKPLHSLSLERQRLIGYGLFGVVTVGVVYTLVVLE
jgi:hypothetical protein